MDGQIGREAAPELYIERLTAVFSELRRALRPDGTFWLNISDTYCGTGSKGEYIDPKYPEGRMGQSESVTQKVQGCKPKDLIGIPWLLAFALRGEGWYLRNDIIWEKANPMPESVRDRCSRSYEHIFLLTKTKKYHFDYLAIAEPIAAGTAARLKSGRGSFHKYADEIPGQRNVQGINRPRAAGTYNDDNISPLRNKRDIWRINTVPYSGAHFAAFPPKLAETCILAGCPENGIVIDPFFGSGTTGYAASKLNRRYIGVELNPEYCELARERIGG
jgi:DNA modification methylase